MRVQTPEPVSRVLLGEEHPVPEIRALANRMPQALANQALEIWMPPAPMNRLPRAPVNKVLAIRVLASHQNSS